jgi:MATE family multidrug resistance protein
MIQRLIERIWKQKRGVAPGSRDASGRAERPNTGARQAPLGRTPSGHTEARTRAASTVTTARARTSKSRPLASLRAPAQQVTALAWPIAIAMLGDTAMGLVDTKLVSALGANAIAGVGVATTLMYVGYAFAIGLMRGVKVRTAHAVGEGRATGAAIFALAGLLLGGLVGVVLLAISRDATSVFTWMQVDPATVSYARDFLAARTLGAPAILMAIALIQYRQGLGDTRTPMVVGLCANVVNAFLAYALIHGRFGFPALGVRGAGIGTAITESLELVALLSLFAREGLDAARRGLGALRLALDEVLRLGLPTGTQFAAEVLSFTTFTAILGQIGAAEVAAHQIAMAIVRTSFLPGLAVGEATSVLIGNALGRRQLTDADETMHAGLGVAAAFMTACGVVFALAGRHIAGVFTDDANVASIIVKLLFVAAVFQTLDAVTMVLRSSLRGAKDVRFPMVVGISVSWVCIPTAAWFLGRKLGMGALGGWFGFLAETTIASAILYARWRVGGWRAQYQPAAPRDALDEEGAPNSAAA